MNTNFDKAKETVEDLAQGLAEQEWDLYIYWANKSRENVGVYVTCTPDKLDNIDAIMNNLGYYRDNNKIDEIKVLYDKAGMDITLNMKNCLEIELDDIESDIHAVTYLYKTK